MRVRRRLSPPGGVVALGMCLLLSVLGCDPRGPGPTQEFAASDGRILSLRADRLEWRPLVRAGLRPGARIAVLRGDPDAGGAYTLRLGLPDGFRLPAHRHAADVQITVVAGTLLFATGERFDVVPLRAHESRDFLGLPAGASHYAEAEGETVLQLHGIGPFTTDVVDPFVPESVDRGGRQKPP